ncbi:MAG: hypothetical protein GY715_14445, partial [Planctomycetes bacterium]|nr:hypothetical protein [Planctomycetota bacterium]
YTLVISDRGGVLSGGYAPSPVSLLPTTPPAAAGSLAVTIVDADVAGINFGYNDEGALTGLIGTTIKDPVGDVDRQIDTLVDDNNFDYDFGYIKLGSIGDRVWHDVDGDGVQDGGAEVGLNTVTVRLFDSSGLVGTDMTSGDGGYLFENLLPGDYTVVVDDTTLPAGFVQTFDITLPLDHQASVTLGFDDNRDDVDFGYRKLGSIGDRVWHDIDGDGVQDGGAEVGLNGVTVRLFDSGGLVDTA